MESFMIYVKTISGCNYHISVLPHETVLDGKKKITNESVEVQRWVYQGKNLEDHQTFKELHMKHGDVVHLVLKLGGGALAFSSMDGKKKFSAPRATESSPSNFLVSTGLNLKCLCDWEKCTTQKYGGYFYVMQGLGKHDVTKFEVRCPECTQPGRIVTPCFVRCSYRIDGVLTADKKRIYMEGSIHGDKVEEYDENKTTEWDSLTIHCIGHVVPHIKE